jgi:hypothetical protein
MDTISGEGANVVISHAAPTSCLQVAIFDAMAAIQSERKSDRLNGCRGLAPVRFWLAAEWFDGSWFTSRFLLLN